ncbi:hypothetical protein [Winogradskyella sp.]|uniref:hypothetical protein n=1 Tax=Winogradskyella sp. TaxID=1883156 RepID=UPI0025F72E97|nr:hypothetical protein [Winogradskyella sp.]
MLLTFFGCKSIGIKNVIKQEKVSGVPFGTSETFIYINLKVYDLVNINTIYIGEKSNRIENYSLYDLSNGMILNPKEILKKGKYYIQIASSNNNLFNNSDEIYLTYYSYGKLKVIKSFIKISDDLLMKSHIKS